METIIVLAVHGAPPSDFPRRDQAEYFGLHHQLDHAGEGDRDRLARRFEELDHRMRSWPRTAVNDPFWAASLELGTALERVTGVTVLVGFNEFCAPSLNQVLDRAASSGPGEVKVVTPMLTRGGEHAERDIPAAIARSAERFPTVRFVYAWPYSTMAVAAFLAARIAEVEEADVGLVAAAVAPQVTYTALASGASAARVSGLRARREVFRHARRITLVSGSVGEVAVQPGLTVNGRLWPRVWSFVCGLGMIVASALTIRHYFLANYPTSIFQGSFCDINTFFNCDSSAYSVISQIAGVPLGYFGLIVGTLVSLGSLFPSVGFERTNKAIALANGLGILTLFLFSVLYLGSLCLLCSAYYVFGLASLFLFWRFGTDAGGRRGLGAFLAPSLKHLATFGVVTLVGAYGMAQFHEAKAQAQTGGVAAQVVKEYYSLPKVASPSIISPFMSARSTEKFEDAPIQVIEYADFLCPDCLVLTQELTRLKQEFKGKVNIAFQFFPLEAKCNTVVEKDLHPGSCDITYIAAHDPAKFQQIHDEIFANFRAARSPEWRSQLARKYGAEAALTDSRTKDLVQRIINTGAEYEKTSDKFSHGIRSTPTMILNNRMVIGTLPYAQLRAIFQALVDERSQGPAKTFIENWVPRS